MTETSRWQRSLLIGSCLVVVTATVYWPVLHFGFVSFDDRTYVTENPHLRGGLTLRGLGWALTTPLDQWMPVTWLARLLECQLFGLNAGAQHLINVVFHIANAVLLFNLLNRMTGAPWRTAFAASLFALHPLHVESVAWVTGLKDVLSMCFGLLTIWAYVRYVEQPNRTRYLLTLGMCVLALMSKPMMVTLPFVLLLLDYWPLGRTRWAEPATGERVKLSPSQLFKEKLPFLVLAAASCVATYRTQRAVGAMQSLESLPMGIRTGNALLSYVRYIGKALWPTELAVFNSLDTNLSLATVLVAGVGLVGMTVAVVWRARRAPWLATGWLWYLGTLVPVIGLVQVGDQSMADRYTYVPLVGLFIMLSWSVSGRAIEHQIFKVMTGVTAGAVLGACAVVARAQVGYWKDSETLFRHALDVTRGNWLAHNSLGVALEQTGRVQEAIGHYEQALKLKPDYYEAHSNLGSALNRLGRVAEAIRQWEQALRINPNYAPAHYDLGTALEEEGRVQEAIGHYKQALRLKPDYAETHYNLGLALWQVGDTKAAIKHWQEALQLQPDNVGAYNNLGNAFISSGRVPEAIGQYEQALRIRPDYAEAHNNLGLALAQAGRIQEAIGHWQRALQLKPDFAEAENNWAAALIRLGKSPEAIAHYEQVLRIDPDSAEAHNDLGNALAQVGKVPEAIGQYEEALRLKPDFAKARNNLAWLLATLVPAEGGDPVRAAALAERACEMTGNRVAAYLDTLAVAYAAAGRLVDAIATAQKAIEMAYSAGQPQLAREITSRLEIYRSGRAYGLHRTPVRSEPDDTASLHNP